MIAKANRFHGRNSLSTVYRKGQSVSLSLVSMKYLPIKDGKKIRLAVVVSRKVDKSAVVRNRIRRRVYEAMRLKSADLKQKGDIVISVHNNTLANIPSNELNDLLEQLLAKAELTDHAKLNEQGEG